MKKIIATIELPDNLTFAEAKQYIIDELAAAGGSLRPDDPLFKGLKVVDVKLEYKRVRGIK